MSVSSPLLSALIVLDTNVVSELMRATPDPLVETWVRSVDPATIYTTAVTLAEVGFGIARLPIGRRRAQLASAAEEVFETFADHVLPFDSTAAAHYANIVVERDRAGAPIAGFDAQIAAICRSRSSTLATRNTADFASLGLHLIDPWQMRT